MHSTLRIPEILSEIFKHLHDEEKEDDNGGPALDAQSLIALSVTCKGFSDPALRKLWHTIPGLWVISYVLPKHWIHISPFRKGRLKIHCNEARKCVGRLASYTRHVRVILKGDSLPGNAFSFSDLYTLYVSCHLPRPLFPSVKEVHMWFKMGQQKHLAFFFPAHVLSPSIRHVHLHTETLRTNPGDARQLDSVVAGLRTIAPHLKSFTIHRAPRRKGPPPSAPALQPLITQFSSSLQALSIAGVSATACMLRALGNLNSLSDLSLGFSNVVDLPVGPGFAFGFPALLNLDIAVYIPQSCDRFLSRILAPAMRSLRIHHPIRDQPPALLRLTTEALAEGISTHGSSNMSQFTSFIFESACTMGSTGRESINIATLRPLCSIPSLDSISIKGCETTDLDGHGLGELFGAFPSLKKFSVTPLDGMGGYFTSKPSLTLAGLHAALQRAPMLESLRLECDAREIPSTLTPFRPHTSLVSWNALTSPITYGEDLARWLQVNYPSLITLEAFGVISTYLHLHSAEPEGRFREQWDDIFEQEESLDSMYMLSQWTAAAACVEGRLESGSNFGSLN